VNYYGIALSLQFSPLSDREILHEPLYDILICSFEGSRGSEVGMATMTQARRLRIIDPMRSLNFFILSAALDPGIYSAS
jgi:hypothetical protein